jgi:hypothetical protein
MEQRVGEFLLHRQDIRDRKPGQHRAHATGNVEADATGRHDAALVRIEGRDSANREAIAPVGVRHGIRRPDDPRQGRDVGCLLVDLVVHVADEVFVGINDRRDQHSPVRLDTPRGGIDAREATGIHLSLRYTSTTHPADQRPFSSAATFSAV